MVRSPSHDPPSTAGAHPFPGARAPSPYARQARFLAAGEPGAAPPSVSAVRIPAELVVGGNAVWVLDALGKRVQRRAVRLGESSDGEVVVLEGLNLSDEVVATRLDELEPGRAVRVAAKER